jgi:hypothetical protein
MMKLSEVSSRTKRDLDDDEEDSEEDRGPLDAAPSSPRVDLRLRSQTHCNITCTRSHYDPPLLTSLKPSKPPKKPSLPLDLLPHPPSSNDAATLQGASQLTGLTLDSSCHAREHEIRASPSPSLFSQWLLTLSSPAGLVLVLRSVLHPRSL